MQAYLILALIFALLVAAFAIQNTAVVTINFLFWLGSVAAGALIFFVLGLIKQFGSSRERKELTRAKEALEGQLAEKKRQLTEAEARLKEALQPASPEGADPGAAQGTPEKNPCGVPRPPIE